MKVGRWLKKKKFTSQKNNSDNQDKQSNTKKIKENIKQKH